LAGVEERPRTSDAERLPGKRLLKDSLTEVTGKEKGCLSALLRERQET
jgi:hypothetical protein